MTARQCYQIHCTHSRSLGNFFMINDVFESEQSSVCVTWWHFVSQVLVSWQAVMSFVMVFSSSFWHFSKVTSMAPLSSTVDKIVGWSMCPVCSWFWKIFSPAKPDISPWKSSRGRSKARQQDNDHCGCLRHFLRYLYWNTPYWTRQIKNDDFMATNAIKKL